MFSPFVRDVVGINPYGADLDPDVKSRALAATEGTLRHLVATLRSHDLPSEMLPTVARIYEQHVAAQGAQLMIERNRDAPILPMEIVAMQNGAPARCRPGDTIVIIEPTMWPYQIEELATEDAASWMIQDVTIGNKTQLARSGEMSATMFMSDTFQGKLKLEPCLRGMDLVIYARYIGVDPEGAVFKTKIRARAWRPTVDPMFAVT